LTGQRLFTIVPYCDCY